MWTPEGEGRDFKLSPTLEPLSDLKDDLIVPTNLWNQASKGSEGHYVKVSGFLTCTTITKTQGVDLNCNGVSMDQLAAQQTGSRTPLPSLELGISPVSTGVDINVGYTRVYGAHVAGAARRRRWRAKSTRVSSSNACSAPAIRSRVPASTTSCCSTAFSTMPGSCAQEVGTADRQRIDEYLSVVRSLEDRLERASSPERSKWKPRATIDPEAKPDGIPKEHAEHVRLMFDMIALAFQTDTTRICTFMFGNEVSNTSFAFLEGVKGGHHDTSHHQKDPEKLRQYQLINRWHVEQYAYLLRKLRNMKEGESSVLDNSMVLFGSGIRDGDAHNPHNAPLVLAGRAGGRIATGQHLVYAEDSPLSNLYVSMLDAFGTPVERFADSTGPRAAS